MSTWGGALSISTSHSTARRAGRLPAELTSFIGRQAELADIRRLLEGSRLATLTGPGGVGKTRLAVRAAGDMGRTFADGVCFVDFAALREPGLLSQTVADALGLGDGPGDALDHLADHVADRHLLLVIDTCEHLVDGCALLAEVLLRAAPRLRIMAASRQPLDIAGEHVYRVDPLPRPDSGAGSAEDAGGDAGACASVELFAERAGAIVPGWSLTEDNREAVAALCRRLDGIPLAIELAAVQLRALSADQILARLDDRLLQVRGRRAALPRHQTMRAAVDWSHQLCSPAERLLWARLSVFAGDFDLESAEHVCSDDALPAAEVVELISGLIGKSIVLRADTAGAGGAARYRMLDTIREYGAERLDRLGGAAELRTRALDWFGRQLGLAWEGLITPAQAAWLAWFRRERDNIRAVLDHAIRTAGDDVLVPMALALGRLWALQGMIGEIRHWMDAWQGARDTTGHRWPEVLAIAGYAAALQDRLGDAREALADVEGRARATGDTSVLAYATGVRGVVALYAGDYPAARTLLDEAADLHEQTADADVLVTINEAFRGLAALLDGDLDAAVRHAERVVPADETRGEQWCASYGLILWAMADLLAGDPDGALPRLTRGLRTKRDIDDWLGIALALEVTAACHIELGDTERGARALGAADEARRFTETSMFGPQHADLRVLFEGKARAAMGDEAYLAAYGAGRCRGAEAAIADLLGERPAPSERAESGPGGTSLTPREAEIAALVAEGLSNRAIAERLVIAKRTVDSHVEHILAKLGHSSRTQIAAWITRNR